MRLQRKFRQRRSFPTFLCALTSLDDCNGDEEWEREGDGAAALEDDRKVDAIESFRVREAASSFQLLPGVLRALSRDSRSVKKTQLDSSSPDPVTLSSTIDAGKNFLYFR